MISINYRLVNVDGSDMRLQTKMFLSVSTKNKDVQFIHVKGLFKVV